MNTGSPVGDFALVRPASSVEPRNPPLPDECLASVLRAAPRGGAHFSEISPLVDTQVALVWFYLHLPIVKKMKNGLRLTSLAVI